MRVMPACCATAKQCSERARCARHISTGPNPKYIGALQTFAMDHVRNDGAIVCNRFDRNIPSKEAEVCTA